MYIYIYIYIYSGGLAAVATPASSTARAWKDIRGQWQGNGGVLGG